MGDNHSHWKHSVRDVIVGNTIDRNDYPSSINEMEWMTIKAKFWCKCSKLATQEE